MSEVWGEVASSGWNFWFKRLDGRGIGGPAR